MLTFKWEHGSKNDNAIKLFKEKGIPFRYDGYFNLVADLLHNGTFTRVNYISLGNDNFMIEKGE